MILAHVHRLYAGENLARMAAGVIHHIPIVHKPGFVRNRHPLHAGENLGGGQYGVPSKVAVPAGTVDQA